MVNIIAVSRQKFDEYCNANNFTDENPPKSGFFICIHNTSGVENTVPRFEGQHTNILNLFFDDCSEDSIGQLVNGESFVEKAFTEDQAEQIINFLDNQKANGNKNGVIHCHAGVSRSGAVATFAAAVLGADMNEFKRLNWRIVPNPHVLATLNRIVWRVVFQKNI